MLTFKLERGFKQDITRRQIGCVNSEWEKSQQRSDDLDLRVRKIPAVQ